MMMMMIMIIGLESIDGEKSEELGGTQGEPDRSTRRHWHLQQGDDHDDHTDWGAWHH